MKTLIFTIALIIVNQAMADDLSKALGAALQEAEKNHSAKQVALEVDADKIEQAKFRKYQAPQVIQLDSEPIIDRSAYSTKDMADEIEVEDAEDISKELGDKQ